MKKFRLVLFTLAFAFACFGADVKGTWKMSANAPDGNVYKFDLTIKEEGGKLAGTVVSPQGSIALQDVKFENDTLTYVMPYEIGPIQMKLTVTGDTMKGVLTIPDGATGTLEGTRAPAAAGPTAASVAGKWKMVSKRSDGGEMRVTLELNEAGGKLSGQVVLESGDVAPIANAKLEGDQLTFEVPTGEGSFAIKLTITGNEMKGGYKSPGGDTGNLTGTKG